MIGSNNRQTRFRILMVDRKVQTELKITDDKKEYNFHEISEVSNSDVSALKMIRFYPYHLDNRQTIQTIRIIAKS